MYSKKKPCPVCEKSIDVRGMSTHVRTQHPDYNSKKPVQSVRPKVLQMTTGDPVVSELELILEAYRRGYEAGRGAA
jgi:hypothetical protein